MRLGKMPYKQEPGTGEGAITVGFPGNLISDSFWCLVTAGQDYFQFFANSGNQFTGNDITSTGVTFHFSGSYLTDDTTWQPLNGATVS